MGKKRRQSVPRVELLPSSESSLAAGSEDKREGNINKVTEDVEVEAVAVLMSGKKLVAEAANDVTIGGDVTNEGEVTNGGEVTLPDDDDDLEDILGAESDDDDEQRVKRKKLAILTGQEIPDETKSATKRKTKKRFKQNDIVWRLFVKNRPWDKIMETGTGPEKEKRRAVVEEDFSRPPEYFANNGEEIHAALYVVKNHRVSGNNKQFHGLPVFDGSSERKDYSLLVPERIEHSRCAPYVRDYEHTTSILNAVKQSHEDLAHVRLEYRRQLEVQLDSVRKYYQTKKKFPAITAVDYLIRDATDREFYVADVTGDRSQLFAGFGDTLPEAEIGGGQMVSREDDDVEDEPALEDEPAPEPCIGNAVPEPSGRREVCEANKKYVDWFESRRCGVYLSQIMNCDVPSERHDMIMKDVGRSVSFDFHSKMARLTNGNFLEDDRGASDLKIAKIVRETVMPKHQHLLQGKLSRRQTLTPPLKEKYIQYCLIPEGLIRAIMELRRIGFRAAQEEFLKHREHDGDVSF